jgi:glycosyltransferase involved in cell wall biosynthesis
LRILFLTQTFPRSPHDSAGPFIRDLARGLVRGGDRVRVLVPRVREISAPREDDGVEVVPFPYAPRFLEIVGYGRTLEADENVRAVARLATPLYLAGARRAVARAARGGEFDLVHAHWVVPNGIAAAGAAPRTPFAIGLHGSDVFLAERRLARPWVRRALRRAALLTSCSPELARRVEALGFDAGRTRVIPYGVDSRLFRPDAGRGRACRERLGLPPDAPVALAVGRMATKKGFHLLVAALPELFARVPELHVLFAGGGDRLAELRAAAARWGERVRFLGAVQHDELPDLYRAADLFVLPAVHDARGNVDGLPNVILEAMASGLPIVASAISGIPLAVEEGVSGRLVEEGDVVALGEAISGLLAGAERRREMGASARRRVERDLTWDAVAARYREGYVAVLSRS